MICALIIDTHSKNLSGLIAWSTRDGQDCHKQSTPSGLMAEGVFLYELRCFMGVHIPASP